VLVRLPTRFEPGTKASLLRARIVLDRDLVRLFELLDDDEAAVSLDDACGLVVLMAGEDEERRGCARTASYSATVTSSRSEQCSLPHSQTNPSRSSGSSASRLALISSIRSFTSRNRASFRVAAVGSGDGAPLKSRREDSIRLSPARVVQRSILYELECLTFPETHIPNALDLLAFVPYLLLKAAGSALRSVQHALAALTVACT
jgi:hypothetical protein